MSAVKGLPSLDSFSGTRALDFSSVKAPTLTEALRLPEISLPKFTAPALTAPAFTAPVIRAPEISTPAFSLAQATRNAPAVIERFDDRASAMQYANNLADVTPNSQFIYVFSVSRGGGDFGPSKTDYRVMDATDYPRFPEGGLDTGDTAALDAASSRGFYGPSFSGASTSTEAIIRGRAD